MATKKDTKPKLGATALSGYWLKGLEELRAAGPYGDSPIAQPTNYAMPGMSTPGEVAEARKKESVDKEADLVAVPQARGHDRDRDDRDMDL